MIDLNQFDGHTPGPWWSDETNVKVGQDPIATAYDPNDTSHRTKTGMTNAKLIAAAPDLLAECKRQAEVIILLTDIINGCIAGFEHIDYPDSANTTKEELSSALAKLEGENPAS